MISSPKNRVQEIKSKFENLTSEPRKLNRSQLYKQIERVKLEKENTDNQYELSSVKDNENESDSDGCPVKPNASYLHGKSDISCSGDLKTSLSRQASDPGKKLHRSHAFRCDRSQKIGQTPKRHGSCNGRSETSDFTLKMDKRISKERLKRFLDEQMKKENFVRSEYGGVEIVGHVSEVKPLSECAILNKSPPKSHYAQLIIPPVSDTVAILQKCDDNVVISENRVPLNSVPDSKVPQHILDQYAKVIKQKKTDSESDKQDAMTDSGVSSETENADEEKNGRFKRLLSQFEKPDTNLKAMDEFCDSSETIRLERKNPHLKLTDTLKKALKQPLPPGPPPKKPPRVFAAPIEENEEIQKSETKRKLEKLEQILQKREQPPQEIKKPKEMHYLCTEILDITNRTLLPDQNPDPLTRCLNSLNCAIKNTSTASLPYTRLTSEDTTRNSLKLCCSSSTDSLNQKLTNKCMNCLTNDVKDNKFKCHLDCKCVGKTSEFYVDNEHIYDTPYTDTEELLPRNRKSNKYGTLNTLKSSKSMDDLWTEDKNIYDVPFEVTAKTTSKSDSPKSDFEKLRNNFEPSEVATRLKPILVTKKSSQENLREEFKAAKKTVEEKFSPEGKIFKSKGDSRITFSLAKRNSQLDLDRENLNSLMNEIYATVSAVCNMDENKPGSFPTESTDGTSAEESVKLTRSLTEKRKNYVRRVSTRVAYLDPKSIKTTRFRHQTSICSYKSEIVDNPYSTFRSWKSFRTSQGNITRMEQAESKINLTDSQGNILSMKDEFDSTDAIDNMSIDEKAGCLDIELPFEPRERGLFNVCLLVGLNYMTGQAYVRSVFPSQVPVPPHIENLIFPETMSSTPKNEWSVDAHSQQCYSLVLTDERGERSYGYCRRVLPEGATTCLPLCYCLIGKYRAPGFYYKVLEEIESHHGSSDVEIQSVLQQLFETDFPRPGEQLIIEYGQTREAEASEGKCRTMPERRLEREFVSYCSENNNIRDSRIKTIKRSIEPRADEDNLSVLLDLLGAGLLIKVFGSLLLERKVIILGDKLRAVSSCMEALQSCLYPFVWQQPLISSIPAEIRREVLDAPLPILAGGLHTGDLLAGVHFEEGMLIDLTHPTKVLSYQGDESTILPTTAYKTLKTALQMETSRNKDRTEDIKTRNVMISEAFLRFFVDILGDFGSYFSVGAKKDGDLGKGDVIFDRDSFIKHTTSRQNQYFLEWFTETAMFNHFIQNMAVTYRQTQSDTRLTQVDTHLSQVDTHLSQVDTHLSQVDTHLTQVDTPLPDFYEIFHERVRSRNMSHKNMDNSKTNYKNVVNKKVRMLKSKLRDLVAS